MENKKQKDYIGYEYKEITVEGNRVSQYLDGYLNFGWLPDENHEIRERVSTTLRLKRDRKIINKAELTRLQRNFEDCMKQIERLEQSRYSTATMIALILGVLGTAFIAGATFAAVHQPPVIWLCIVLAIPGFIGWITPYFAYVHIFRKRAAVVAPLIEAKYEEIYSLCEKGNRLLGAS